MCMRTFTLGIFTQFANISCDTILMWIGRAVTIFDIKMTTTTANTLRTAKQSSESPKSPMVLFLTFSNTKPKVQPIPWAG